MTPAFGHVPVSVFLCPEKYFAKTCTNICTVILGVISLTQQSAAMVQR